jgi:hypothetical protein
MRPFYQLKIIAFLHENPLLQFGNILGLFPAKSFSVNKTKVTTGFPCYSR